MSQGRGPRKSSDTQYQRFLGAAREIGCDEGEARFDAALRKVARYKPVKDAKPEPEMPDDGK